MMKHLKKNWIKYQPPLKEKIELETWVVNWKEDNNNLDSFLKETQKDFALLAPIIPEIVDKFTNTINFIRPKKTASTDYN